MSFFYKNINKTDIKASNISVAVILALYDFL